MITKLVKLTYDHTYRNVDDSALLASVAAVVADECVVRAVAHLNLLRQRRRLHVLREHDRIAKETVVRHRQADDASRALAAAKNRR